MHNKSKKYKKRVNIKKISGGADRDPQMVDNKRKNSENKPRKKKVVKKVTWGNRGNNGKYNFNNEQKNNLKTNKISDGWCSLDIEKN